MMTPEEVHLLARAAQAEPELESVYKEVLKGPAELMYCIVTGDSERAARVVREHHEVMKNVLAGIESGVERTRQEE